MVIAFAIFPAIKVKIYWRNNTDEAIGDFFNNCLTLSSIVFKLPLLYSNRFREQAIVERHVEIFTFLCGAPR
jgi:hypothetical protein